MNHQPDATGVLSMVVMLLIFWGLASCSRWVYMSLFYTKNYFIQLCSLPFFLLSIVFSLLAILCIFIINSVDISLAKCREYNQIEESKERREMFRAIFGLIAEYFDFLLIRRTSFLRKEKFIEDDCPKCNGVGSYVYPNRSKNVFECKKCDSCKKGKIKEIKGTKMLCLDRNSQIKYPFFIIE